MRLVSCYIENFGAIKKKEIDFKNRLILDLNKKNAGNKYYTIIGDLYKMPFIYVISLKDFMKRGKMYAKILVYEDIPF